MKIIAPSFEILEMGINLDAPKAAEYGGRKCYQSTHKIGDGTWRKFVEMVATRGHTSVLEHGSLYFEIDFIDDEPVCDEAFHDVLESPHTVISIDDDNRARVYTNLRVIQEHHVELFGAIMDGDIGEFHWLDFFTPAI
ncbi:MAG: FAD-dependent thymidylate synthase, partial [Candidatus Nomurabacteria bacterium]|nr:FAD-dependent thymidylate synthase [Candidatus Nomurabacteria bacterium]